MTPLERAATNAGLIDMDVLKAASPGMTPDEAVADLRRRVPGAFRTHPRDMSDAEFDEAVRRQSWRTPPPDRPGNDPRAAVRAMTNAQFAAAVAARAWRT